MTDKEPDELDLWDTYHDQVCDIPAAICSRHKTGAWEHLVLDALNRTYLPKLDPAREVRDLHRPDASGEFCNHCWPGPTRSFVPAAGTAMAEARWPCATILALDLASELTNGS